MHLTIHPFSDLRLGPIRTLRTEQELVAKAGRVTVIEGDSGCGKSSLLEILAGCRGGRTVKGDLKIQVCRSEGEPPIPLTAFRAEAPSRLAYLPQATVLRPFISPKRLLQSWRELLSAAYCRQDSVPRYVDAAQKELTTALFGVTEQDQIFDRKRVTHASTLSGGQKRRLDVVLTLTAPAEIILLDEPDTGLHGDGRKQLYDELVEFAKSRNRIVILVSHHASGSITGHDFDCWRITVNGGALDGCVEQLEQNRGSTALPVPAMHSAPEDNHDRRIYQAWAYLKLRLAGDIGNWQDTCLWRAGIPVALLLLIRGALAGSTGDDASMKELFFFSVTTFWLGAVQTGNFWAEEFVWFRRECLQGVSRASYVAGFMLHSLLVAGLQCACATAALLVKNTGINSEYGKVFVCGIWSAANGLVAGLLTGSVLFWLSRRKRPAEAPNAKTAQLCVLLVTLIAIVYSYPVIGVNAYSPDSRPSCEQNTHNRMAIIAAKWQDASRTNLIQTFAVLAAEAPWLSQSPFHALWFQGEQYLQPGRDKGDASSSLRREVVLNMGILLLAVGGCLLFARSFTRYSS